MTDKPTEPSRRNGGDDFAREAEHESVGMLREFWDFLAHEKKWWLAPILVVLLLVGAALVLASTVAPSIYTLF